MYIDLDERKNNISHHMLDNYVMSELSTVKYIDRDIMLIGNIVNIKRFKNTIVIEFGRVTAPLETGDDMVSRGVILYSITLMKTNKAIISIRTGFLDYYGDDKIQGFFDKMKCNNIGTMYTSNMFVFDDDDINTSIYNLRESYPTFSDIVCVIDAARDKFYEFTKDRTDVFEILNGEFNRECCKLRSSHSISLTSVSRNKFSKFIFNGDTHGNMAEEINRNRIEILQDMTYGVRSDIYNMVANDVDNKMTPSVERILLDVISSGVIKPSSLN